LPKGNLLLLVEIWRKKLLMTISKVSPLLCLLAAGVVCPAVRADDNAAQAAARIALAKALFDANSQPTASTPAAPAPVAPPPAAPAPVAPPPAPVAAPVVPPPAPPPPVAAQPAAAPTTGDNPAQAAARAALAQKLFEQSSAPSAPAIPPPPPPPTVAPAPAPVAPPPPAVVTAPAEPVAVQPGAAPAGDNAAQAAARAALAQKLFEQSSAQPAAAPVPQPAPVANSSVVVMPAHGPTTIAPTTAAPTTVATPGSGPNRPGGAFDSSYYVGRELGLKPITTPALPINGTKQQRLQVLLDKYKADQISPQEYHQQRAAILSEP